ncbi:MAG: isocitrate dehydrogenase kinase/phosphatase AceK regulatory subunit [Halofilum sp. (in: g-proteobacteria)]
MDTPLVQEGYARLRAAVDHPESVAATADLILAIFDEFYGTARGFPFRAQRAFERMDPAASLRISRERLGLYSRYVAHHGPRIQSAYPALIGDEPLWGDVDAHYLKLIENRYEADIAFSFARSIRRNICHSIWQPVGYSFSAPNRQRAKSLAAAHARFRLAHGIDASVMRDVLLVPGLTAPFRDARRDADRIADRVNWLIAYGELDGRPVALDMIKGGFYRDLTAFLVGRFVFADGTYQPFAVCLLNSDSGIYVDAVLHRSSDLHSLFSSTLANFHVTNELYYQVCAFLHSVMPARPLGLHYSTIGFNHVGKAAILNEIREQMASSGQRFEPSPGFEGTVAMGFTFEACRYHLKVVRDRPTDEYKWGEFPGVDAVLEKYRLVHDINRTGSMLDNVMYFNLQLDRAMFDPQLLADLCKHAAGNVCVEGDLVLIRSLIGQFKITPLPVFLESASEAETEEAMINLGHCVRNNAVANIFNRDLDARNYGIGYYGKVFLFDYDAVEQLTDVKVRTNLDRIDGEDDPPEWFFEEGVVFLPEELEAGLRIHDRTARRYFRKHNADLLMPSYWWDLQQRLQRGEVLSLRLYPESRRLRNRPKIAEIQSD